jgi:hypothetical protein
MNKQADGSLEVLVIPVLEVALKTFRPSRSTEAGKFAARLFDICKSNNFAETPDGWFVPLGILFPEIPGLAKFLEKEAYEANEFVLFGGFQIYFDGSAVPLITEGTIVRYAMQITQKVIDRDDENVEPVVFIDNDRYAQFTIMRDTNKVKIRVPAYKYEKMLPYDKLVRGLKQAQDDVRKFSEIIGPLLLESGEPITAENIKFMFGLDDLA